MAPLIAQAGGGTYARLQASIDGSVLLEFGEIAGGAFYPAGKAERIYAPCFDGAGWDMAMVFQIICAKQPRQAQSTRLTEALEMLTRQYRIELQKSLQIPIKDADDWARIARLIRRCAEAGTINEVTLLRYAQTLMYPPWVRNTARSAALALAN